MYDSLCFDYLQNNSVIDLFEDAKDNIENIFSNLNRGIIQKHLAKAISQSIKIVNHFAKTTKDKKLEADLLLFLLTTVFDTFSEHLGTCWTVFDSKLAITTNRLLNLIKKKLHEDYWIEYNDRINSFLRILKSKCNHLDYVYNMPRCLEEKSTNKSEEVYFAV
ncbi:MAG: hypothetical protein V1720_17435 [bacterium]